LPPQEQLVTIAGVACIKDEQVARLRPWSMIEVRPRCLGGKGGFGAMLRGQASRPGMKKVQANTGAMRDLSGRRIRHVEQEAQLQEWAAEEEKRREQLEKEKAAKRQKFAHNVHEEAVNYVAEAVVDRDSVTDAVKQGIVGEKTRKDVTSKEVPQAMRTAKKLDKIWNVDEFDDEDEEDGSVDQPQDKTSKQAAATETSEMQAKQAAARAKKVEKEEQIEKAEQKAEVAERPGATTGAAKEQEDKTAIKETVEKSNGEGITGNAQEDIDIDQVPDLESLLKFGGERLKFALSKRGLKCGGRPEERAQRLWSIKGVPPEKWPAKIKQGK